jgi:FkbM family methyltransferase
MLKTRLRSNPHARRLREVLRAIPEVMNSQSKSVARKCISSEIVAILDVGANVGQFAIDMRRNGYKNYIYSYEPVADTFSALMQRVSKDEKWQAFNLALGETEDFRSIHVSGNSGLSSSLLTMDSVHLENFPKSSYVSSESVLLSTVDRQVDLLKLDPQSSMMKIDVQGYEFNVLQGSIKTLQDFRYCYLEVSLVKLYQGESTFFDILKRLEESGHKVIDLFRGVSARDGSLLQVDVLTQSRT